MTGRVKLLIATITEYFEGILMAIVNILTRKAPTINGYEFDAVLEDTLEISNELTGYPIELGARASDHAITNPVSMVVDLWG